MSKVGCFGSFTMIPGTWNKTIKLTFQGTQALMQVHTPFFPYAVINIRRGQTAELTIRSFCNPSWAAWGNFILVIGHRTMCLTDKLIFDEYEGIIAVYVLERLTLQCQ